jgi:hypothetical protein
VDLFSCQCRDQKKIFIISAVLVRHQHSIFFIIDNNQNYKFTETKYTADKNPEGTWSILLLKRMKASKKQLKWIIFVSITCLFTANKSRRIAKY